MISSVTATTSWSPSWSTVLPVGSCASPKRTIHAARAPEAASGARAAWLVRFGEAQLPTSGTVLQDGDQLVVAVTDDLTARVHAVVERTPEGGHR